MATGTSYSINIPAVNQRYEYPGAPAGAFKNDMTHSLSQLRALYYNQMLAASQLTGLPVYIIAAFSAVEDTTNNPTLVSPAGAIGLMQVTPASGADAISIQAGSFTPTEKAFVMQYLPQAFDANGKVVSVAQMIPFMSSALTIPIFNFYVGALMLSRFLVSSKRQYGQYRLDHAIIKYNAGTGNFTNNVVNAGLSNSDTATLVSNFPFKETTDYILKVMGKDGTLDILKQQGQTG